MEVFLSVGSNINREQNSRSAVSALRQSFGELLLSPVYESAAVGFDGAPFYNFVVRVETAASITRVNELLKEIEDQHGRQRGGPKFSSRSLDIDVVTYGEHVGELEGVKLPRPELFYNAFVLLPMADLLGERLEPKTGKTYSELRAELAPAQKIEKIEFDFS